MHLAGLGVNIAHVEESLDHSHVLLSPHRGECHQHEGGVASSILVVNLADPWETEEGSVQEADTSWSTHFPPSIKFTICLASFVTEGHA